MEVSPIAGLLLVIARSRDGVMVGVNGGFPDCGIATPGDH